MSSEAPLVQADTAATEAMATGHCPNVTRCPLFPRFRLKASLRLWKTFYCEADYEGCARWRLSCQGSAVPPDLLPDGSRIGQALQREQS